MSHFRAILIAFASITVSLLFGLGETSSVFKPSRRINGRVYANRLGVVADSPTVSIYIDETVHYPVSGPQADIQWRSLLPESRHLYCSEEESKNYTVAMFHQLECLDILRIAYISRNVTEETSKCFNYLQQTFLCHSDRRLESVRWVGKPHILTVPGYYQCRDWEALYRSANKGYGAAARWDK